MRKRTHCSGKLFFLAVLASIFCLCQFSAYAQTYYWVATVPGSWGDANNWSTMSGGSGGAGVPTGSINAVFDGASVAGIPANGNCLLLGSATLNAISIIGYTGVIDLNGFNLTANTSAAVPLVFSTGKIESSAGTRNFTLNGSASVPITFSGTRFEASVNLSVTGRIFLNGSTFNGVSVFAFQSTGNGIYNSTGGNTFNNATTLNATAGDISNHPSLGNNFPDVFNDPLSISGYIKVANDCAGNQINNTVTFLPGPNNGQIWFGDGANGSTIIGANGRLISVAATPYRGILSLKRVMQTGSLAHSLFFSTLNSSVQSWLDIGTGCGFNGDLSFQGRNLSIDGTGTSFNGNCIFDVGYQLASALSLINYPIFNGTTTFTTNRLTSNYGNYAFGGIFNGNFSFTRNGFADIILGWNTSGFGSATPCSFGRNVSITNTVTQRIYARFIGNVDQALTSTGPAPTFYRFEMNKTLNTTGRLFLSTPITIGGVPVSNAIFTEGVVVSTSANIPTFVNGVTLSSVSNRSYVEGPVKKVGNEAFNFPTGNSGYYARISITAPSVATDAFIAEYVPTSARTGVGSALGAGLVKVSDCEYWTLQRTAGSSNPNVTLTWGLPNSAWCLVNVPSELRVGQWNASQWIDRGGAGTGGSTPISGQVTSTAVNFSAGSTFALASSTLNNPLPIELVSFDGESHDDGVKLLWVTASEIDNDHFEIERAGQDLEFSSIGSVNAKPTSSENNYYEYMDEHPFVGTNYYRLKQVDLDGTTELFDVIHVNFEQEKLLFVYPNPVLRGEKISISKRGNFLVVSSLGTVIATLKQIDEFDTAGLMPGIFTLVCDDGNAIRFIVK